MSESFRPLSQRVYRLVRLAQVAGTPQPGPRHSGYWWEAQLMIAGADAEDPASYREVLLPHDHSYAKVLMEASRSGRPIRETGSPADLSWHLELEL